MIVCWKCSLLGDGRCESHQSWLRSLWKRVRMWEYCHAGMSAPRVFFVWSSGGWSRHIHGNQSVTRTSQWDPQLMALLGEVASRCRRESNSGYVPKKKIPCWQVLKALFASYLFHPVPEPSIKLMFQIYKENCSVQSVKWRNTRRKKLLLLGWSLGMFPEVSFPEVLDFVDQNGQVQNCGVFFSMLWASYPTRKTLEFGTMFWDTGKSQRCGNLTGTTLNASHSGSKRATPAVSGSPNCCNKRTMKHDLQTYQYN